MLDSMLKDRGWSRAELARRSSMNAATVSNILNGRQVPYPVQSQKMAEALGLTEKSFGLALKNHLHRNV